MGKGGSAPTSSKQTVEVPVVVPFLKWPGGKRWLVASHAHLFPSTYARYIEPFLGSGSVFFHLQPNRAILGDANEELIAAYRGVRNLWKKTMDALEVHDRRHGKRYYYKVRGQQPRSAAERAARMIYLNRTCFNGIYRVNLRGEFNVPKGSKNSVLFDTDDFGRAAQLLRNAELHVADFAVLVNKAERGDFVFADPPYTVRHNLNGFIKYNETLFSWDDQERLALVLANARDRGAHIVSTNANHESLRSLYRSHGFRLQEVARYSSISADSSSRRQFEELLVLSD